MKVKDVVPDQGESVNEGQKMMQIPDLDKMLVNVRVPEAFVRHLHSAIPGDKASRQPATVKVDAFPAELLKGHVKMVDTMASQQDWFASDVKVYKTLVAIHSDPNSKLPRLLPQMPSITAPEDLAAHVRSGRAVNLPDFSRSKQVKVFCGQSELIAIATRVAGTLFHPKIVFPAESAVPAGQSSR